MFQLVGLAVVVVKLITYPITAPLKSIGKNIKAYLVKYHDTI